MIFLLCKNCHVCREKIVIASVSDVIFSKA